MAPSPDWRGKPIPPSQLQALVRDSPFTRAYRAGPASRLPKSLAASFEDYLAAKLRARIERPEDVFGFLSACAYVRDLDQHGRPEVWLHPEDFERRRAGDCEDRALWAWIRFVRLGWEARFTAGLLEGGGHAWVTLFRGAEVLVCETTSREAADFLLPAAERAGYEPVWSVDGEARFHVHVPPPDEGIAFLE